VELQKTQKRLVVIRTRILDTRDLHKNKTE